MTSPEKDSMENGKTSVVPQAIRELLDQRSTYRDWLSRLDDVGGAFRSDVAERVRADYQERLSGVAEELEGHRAEIESSLQGRLARLEELTTGFERRSTELEEAKLRYEVGEYDENRWDEQRETLTDGLEEIEADLGEAREAVGELERVLGELSGPSPSGPTLAVYDGGLAEHRSGTVESESEGATEITAGAGLAADAELAADEHEVEPEDEPEPVSGTAASAAQEEAPVERGTDSADEEPGVRQAVTAGSLENADTESDDYADELEFLESLSLDDPDSFDAVSRMLEDEEDR